MRIGGLASGIDIDEMVDKLMAAERKPLERMEQDKTKLEWKRDGFRDINKSLLELKNMMLDMKFSKTYNSKSTSSSNESAVKASAGASASNGTYKIEVEKLATSAMNIGTKSIEENLEKKLSELETTDGFKLIKNVDKNIKGEYKIGFKVNGKSQAVGFNGDDTVEDVLAKINKENNGVRAFRDENTGKVIIETTRTGNYNEGGKEIEFEAGSFFTDVLHMSQEDEFGGTNATFTYNDHLTLESKDNSYELNGIKFNFTNTNVGNPAVITVDNDTDQTFDKIVKFVDKYNEVIEEMNGSQREERHRDFPPLTEEQMGEMSDKEIERWEEKAKSGILKGESTISNGMFSMRNAWYSSVETGGEFTSLTQIGIKTSTSYMDGGKLIINEDKLKAALENNAEDVQKLFSNSSDNDEERGLINRLEDSLKSTMDTIKAKAGGNSSTLENYTLGKRMKEIDTRMDSFQDRLVKVEDRYWRQFTAMEKAIQQMNQQSDYLMSQFSQQ